MLSMPLRQRGEVAGAIRVYSREHRVFSREEKGFVEAVANLTGVAVESGTVEVAGLALKIHAEGVGLPTGSADLHLAGDLAGNYMTNAWKLSGLDLGLEAPGGSLPLGRLAVALKGALEADLGADRIALAGLEMTAT